jgi:catechol 2,3-dioxygenase-like lactoylglutathione lyase family enzyme
MMAAVQFQSLHPIVGTRDIERAIAFYTTQLGFAVAFRDSGTPTNYAGLRRDGVELHMQFQYEHEMGTIRVRFRVTNPDALLAEYRAKKVEIQNDIRNTQWGTREFALYDLDRNALTFYRALRDGV